MKIFNCCMQDVENVWKGKKIVFFGGGSWLNTIKYTEIMNLKKEFLCVVDNNKRGKIFLEDVELDVVSPDFLLGKHNIIVLLCSPVYMYDMYTQLSCMGLEDDVLCYVFPFMLLESKGECNSDLYREVQMDKEGEKIPKIIHGFWFSGEKKPDSYQRCLDSWYRNLQDYEIIEWTQDNYPVHSHPFLQKAIECGAWAFAADYARLDVLDTYGGIYLDMDVEVFKPFDCLLGNDAIFSFSNYAMIDLAVLGAKKDNHIIKSLKGIYDNMDIPKEKKEFVKFHQPNLIRDRLHESGIKFNGSLQKIEGGVVFPSSFFMPMEHVLFRDFDITDHTYCVHMDNFGWSFSGDNKREKKIRDNRLLWEKIQNT